MMDCKEFEDKISDYIDGDLLPVDKESFEQHMVSCGKCSDKYKYMVEMLDSLQNMTPVETPPSFSQNIIETIKHGKKKKIRHINIKKILSYAAVFMLGIFVVSMGNFLLPILQNSAVLNENDMAAPETAMDGGFSYGSGGNTAADTSNSYGGDDSEKIAEQEQQSIRDKKENVPAINNPTGVVDKDKVIYRGDIYLNVKDVKESTDEITKYIESQNGFVESASMSGINEKGNSAGRSYLIARVPSEKFMEVKNKLGDFGEELNSHHEAINITTQYRNLITELDSLKIQEERLLTYLKKADKMADMITIETELNRVRTNINMLQTQLNGYDRQLEYSSIRINLTESKTMNTAIKSPFGDLWGNISKGFISSINMLLQIISFIIILFVKIIPFLVIIVPAGFIIKKYVLKR